MFRSRIGKRGSIDGTTLHASLVSGCGARSWRCLQGCIREHLKYWPPRLPRWVRNVHSLWPSRLPKPWRLKFEVGGDNQFIRRIISTSHRKGKPRTVLPELVKIRLWVVEAALLLFAIRRNALTRYADIDNSLESSPGLPLFTVKTEWLAQRSMEHHPFGVQFGVMRRPSG